MKIIITALALLTLFGFTDKPQQTDKDPNQIVISEGFAARPRIIVIRKAFMERPFAEPRKQINYGGGKEVEK
ncbi:MAG: hypothetical protein ACYSW7_11925 [Planctomycetota bacterium]|jgi:hypothetical protein